MLDDDDTHLFISELISDGIDAGDELMNFMKAALADDCNLTDKTSSPTPDELENNITNDNLCMLINELKKTHTAKMMFFTTEQEKFFYDTNLWREFVMSEKANVQKCCLSRMTKISLRTKKLTELDFQLFLDFNKKCSNNDNDTVMYLLCVEFIKLSRKFRHSPAFVHNIPTLVHQLFTNKVHVMTEEELEVICYVDG